MNTQFYTWSPTPEQDSVTKDYVDNMGIKHVPKEPRPTFYIKDNMYSYYTVEEKAMTSFFNKKTAPNHILKRTGMLYKSMPLEDLKKTGKWNARLDKIAPYLPKGVWIAGGFLRAMIAGEDELGGDIDFFFNTEESFNQMLDLIKHPTSVPGAEKAFNYYAIPDYESIEELRIIDCESLAGFRPNIQLVRLFWFDSPEHVIDSFDFTVCQFITDGKTLWYEAQAFDDVKTKALKQHRETGDAIAALNRILKYQSKGYKIDPVVFKDVETNAIDVLNNPGKIQEYFYNERVEGDIHKRLESSLQRAWDYLETAPASAATYAKAMKKGINAVVSASTLGTYGTYGGGYTISGTGGYATAGGSVTFSTAPAPVSLDKKARTNYSWDGS